MILIVCDIRCGFEQLSVAIIFARMNKYSAFSSQHSVQNSLRDCMLITDC